MIRWKAGEIMAVCLDEELDSWIDVCMDEWDSGWMGG